MNYVYHGVSEKMIGDRLIPLSQMKDERPELYTQQKSKYKGREEILERRIPLLDCLWNDVVQFLPVHPTKIFKLQLELGLIPEMPPYKYFEIDLSQFNPENAVVYFKTAPGEENVEVRWLKDVKLEDIQEVPSATINYYKTLVGTGELPFNYQLIPHVVYMGSVDISTSHIIRL